MVDDILFDRGDFFILKVDAINETQIYMIFMMILPLIDLKTLTYPKSHKAF